MHSIIVTINQQYNRTKWSNNFSSPDGQVVKGAQQTASSVQGMRVRVRIPAGSKSSSVVVKKDSKHLNIPL